MTDKEKIRQRIENDIKAFKGMTEDVPEKKKVLAFAVGELSSLIDYIDTLDEKPKFKKSNETNSITEVDNNSYIVSAAEAHIPFEDQDNWEAIYHKFSDFKMVDAAESLGITQEQLDDIVDEMLYGDDEKPFTGGLNKQITDYADKYSHEVWEKLMNNFDVIEDYFIGCNDVSDIVLNAIIDACQHFRYRLFQQIPTSDDMEKAAEKYVFGFHSSIQRMCKDCFIDGAKWNQSKVESEGVHCIVRDDGNSLYTSEAWAEMANLLKRGGFKEGDKVKLVVLKQQEDVQDAP